MNLCILWMPMSQRAEENSVFGSLSEFKQKTPKVIDYSKHSPSGFFCTNHLEVQAFTHTGFWESLMLGFSMHAVGASDVRQNHHLWGVHHTSQVGDLPLQWRYGGFRGVSVVAHTDGNAVTGPVCTLDCCFGPPLRWGGCLWNGWTGGWDLIWNKSAIFWW